MLVHKIYTMGENILKNKNTLKSSVHLNAEKIWISFKVIHVDQYDR